MPGRRNTDCRVVKLTVGCRDRTGCQGQEGHETDLSIPLGSAHDSPGRNNRRNPPMSQQLFFSPAHRKALDKKKLRKGNSSHLSIPARGRSNKDCCRCQRRNGHTGAALTHTDMEQCQRWLMLKVETYHVSSMSTLQALMQLH